MSAVSRFLFPFERKTLAIACALVIANLAHAETLEERVQALEKNQERSDDASQLVNALAEKTHVSGFISVRGGQVEDKSVNYLTTMDGDWSFSDDSVAGLQVDTTVSDQLSASLQVKASTLDKGVELEWGYLEYAFQPDLKLRAGRLRAPGFMLSEFLDVGYAYPWVQVPQEVYGWLPFSRYEGMDLRYWTSVGDVDIRLNTYLGTTADQELRLAKTAYADQDSQFAGLDVQMTYDIYSFRVGYSKYKFELSNSKVDSFLDPLLYGTTDGSVSGLIPYVEDIMVGMVLDPAINDPANAAIVDFLTSEKNSLLSQLEPYRHIPEMNGNQDGDFFGVGFSADNGNFLVMSELSSSSIEGSYPDMDSGYIMFGYRFGNWMPHITFSKMYTTNDDERPDLQPFELNSLIWNSDPQLAALASGLNTFANGAIQAMNVIKIEQETVTLGVRWDPVQSLAVKAEVFRVMPQNASYGFAIPDTMVKALDADFESLLNTSGLQYEPPLDKLDGVLMSFDLVF